MAMPEKEIQQALTRYAGIDDVVFVPYDRVSLDQASPADTPSAEVGARFASAQRGAAASVGATRASAAARPAAGIAPAV